MVNMGQVHREIRKFMMFSSKLIKSDDKFMMFSSTESRIIKIDLDFVEKLKFEVQEDFQTL